MEIFVGVLMGILAGMFLSARYLRQEISANIGPRLIRIERQLEIVEAEMRLDATTRLAALSKRCEDQPPQG